MVPNTLNSGANDEYSTGLPFNVTQWEEGHTTDAALSAHDDYNAFCFTHPPPPTDFTPSMDAFDPFVPPSVSFVPHNIPSRELIHFFLVLQEFHIPYSEAIVPSVRPSQHRINSTNSISSTHPAEQSTIPGMGTLPDQSNSQSGHSARTLEDPLEGYMHHGSEAGVAKWFCLKCNKRSNTRRNRMRDHVAQCLGHNLYLCGGSCGVSNW